MFNRRTVITIALIMLVAAGMQFAMGRKLWGVGGAPGLWSGDIWSSHNSQFLLDPYTLTHVTHGFLFYALLALVFGTLPVNTRLLLAVGIEAAWEVLENTSWIIQRYRAATISLDYFGDSIVNSMGDILACILGFTLAAAVSKRTAIAFVIGLEIVLLIWTRDNLALNIVMLVHPSQAIRNWQLGN